MTLGIYTDGPQDCIKIHNGHMAIKDSLRSVIEEADARIIPHIAASIEEGLERCRVALDKMWVG